MRDLLSSLALGIRAASKLREPLLLCILILTLVMIAAICTPNASACNPVVASAPACGVAYQQQAVVYAAPVLAAIVNPYVPQVQAQVYAAPVAVQAQVYAAPVIQQQAVVYAAPVVAAVGYGGYGHIGVGANVIVRQRGVVAPVRVRVGGGNVIVRRGLFGRQRVIVRGGR